MSGIEKTNDLPSTSSNSNETENSDASSSSSSASNARKRGRPKSSERSVRSRDESNNPESDELDLMDSYILSEVNDPNAVWPRFKDHNNPNPRPTPERPTRSISPPFNGTLSEDISTTASPPNERENSSTSTLEELLLLNRFPVHDAFAHFISDLPNSLNPEFVNPSLEHIFRSRDNIDQDLMLPGPVIDSTGQVRLEAVSFSSSANEPGNEVTTQNNEQPNGGSDTTESNDSDSLESDELSVLRSLSDSNFMIEVDGVRSVDMPAAREAFRRLITDLINESGESILGLRPRTELSSNEVAQRSETHFYHVVARMNLTGLSDYTKKPTMDVIQRIQNGVAVQKLDLCCICLDENAANCLCRPCGHNCICRGCMEQFRRWVCPMCRTPVDKIEIYV